MSLVLLGIVPLLFVLGATALLAYAARRADAARTRGTPAPEERTVALVRIAGVVVGVALGGYVTTLDNSGLGTNVMLAPVAFGLVVLTAVTLAELAVRPRFADGPRTASLRPRSLGDHLPRALTITVAVLTVAAALLCTWSVAVAHADDMGRPGRELFAFCSATTSSGRGPFPGSFYVTPYAIGVAAALVIAVTAAWVVHRRTLGGTPEQAERHRRVGLTSIVGAYGVVVSMPLVGIAFFAGTTTLGHTCPQPGWTAMGWFSVAVSVAAFWGSALSGLAVLVPSALSGRLRDRVPSA